MLEVWKAPPSLVFCEYTEDRDPCVVTTLNEYIKLTYQRHAEKRRSQLLLSFIQTYVEVSSTTVSRWIKESLKLAGIDVSIFKSQQEQPFLLRLVRKVFLCQISLQEVLGPVAQHSRDFIIRKLWMRMVYIRKPFLVNMNLCFKQRMEDWAPVW